MATRFWYPTFMRLGTRLLNYLNKHQRDMVALNNITDPELTQLNNLATALDVVFGKTSTFPPYREGL